MAFLVCMPVCVSGTLCADAAGNDNNPATFFYPVNEFISVISPLSAKISLPLRPNGSSKACAMLMSLRFPQESKKRNGFPSPSVTAWTFVVKPPLLRPVSS